MVEIHNVHKAIENLTPIADRGPDTPEDVVVAGFEILGRGDFRHAAINLGTFDGDAGWERHSQGDEIVHVVSGEVDITMLVEGEKETVKFGAWRPVRYAPGHMAPAPLREGGHRPDRHPRRP